MDHFLDELDTLNIKRRTTYKKSTDVEQNESPLFDPSVMGHGFLFQNDSIKRVRNRLNRDELAVTLEKPTQLISQTQVMTNFYGGGEEVEIESIPRKLEESSIEESQTQPIATGDDLSVTQRDHSQSYNVRTHAPHHDLKTQRLRRAEIPKEDTSAKAEGHFESTQKVPSTFSNMDNPHESGVNSGRHAHVPELKMHAILQGLNEQQDVKCHPFEIKEEAVFKNKTFISKKSFLEDFDDSSSDDGGGELNIKLPDNWKKEPSCPSKNLDVNFTLMKKYGALKNYENELKRESKSERVISLYSDDESGDESLSQIPKSFASKASLLEIRARLSRTKKPPKNVTNGTSLKTLFGGLKKASKKQIADRRKQMMEQRGLNLEDIEKEKQVVEDLLEQEIARNRRIRMREKESTLREDFLEEEQDYSANEELDQSDAVYNPSEKEKRIAPPVIVLRPGSLGSQGEEEDQNEGGYEVGDQEENEEKDEDENEDEDEDDDEDDQIKTKRKKSNQVKVVDESDVDSELDVDAYSDEEKKNNNAIDLGTYGDNLTGNAKTERQTSTDSEKDSEDEEGYHAVVDAEQKIKKLKEMKNKEKIKEMKRSGVSKMFEIEAEESDDEWHGLGGADGELSDEYDSEVEKMIDDYSRANVDADQIRNMLVTENREVDLKMVNRILHDVKNGGFRKRRSTSMVIELSDDEDEDLENYRLKRREIMRQKRLQVSEEDKKHIKNSKAKAFFESMVEDILDQKDSFEAKKSDSSKPEKDSIEGIDYTAEKRKLTISEEFVQQSLSFLKSARDLEQVNSAVEQEASDLFNLKQDSFIKRLHSPVPLTKQLSNRRHTGDLGHTLASNQRSSVCEKFGSYLGIDDKLKNGKKTVTVSKSYKAVGGNRASVTYLGKMRRLVAPGEKTKKTPNRFRISKSRVNSLFESNDNSFEVL